MFSYFVFFIFSMSACITSISRSPQDLIIRYYFIISILFLFLFVVVAVVIAVAAVAIAVVITSNSS